MTLTSDSRGNQVAEVVTDAGGDFTFINVRPDKYTIQVNMSGFKPTSRAESRSARVIARRSASSPSRSARSPTPVVVGRDAAGTGAERRAILYRADEAVENLPIANRSFTALATLAPGVTSNGLRPATLRIGGGGDTNIMMDGVGVMDTGSNRRCCR